MVANLKNKLLFSLVFFSTFNLESQQIKSIKILKMEMNQCTIYPLFHHKGI